MLTSESGPSSSSAPSASEPLSCWNVLLVLVVIAELSPKPLPSRWRHRFPTEWLVIEFKIEVACADIALVGNDELKTVGFIDVL